MMYNENKNDGITFHNNELSFNRFFSYLTKYCFMYMFYTLYSSDY